MKDVVICANSITLLESAPCSHYVSPAIGQMYLYQIAKWICVKCICCCLWQIHMKDVTQMESAPPSHYVSPPIGGDLGGAPEHVL